MGIDIWEVIEAASTKPFGFQPFYPGPGIGGHCIPVDPFYLSWRAQQFQQPTRFIELAGEVNEAMPAFIVQSAQKSLGGLRGRRVLLLGIAYSTYSSKPGPRFAITIPISRMWALAATMRSTRTPTRSTT